MTTNSVLLFEIVVLFDQASASMRNILSITFICFKAQIIGFSHLVDSEQTLQVNQLSQIFYKKT